MSVNLSISTEEAQVILHCLGYVRRNIVVDGDGRRFRFVSGKPLNLTIREGVSLDFLRDYIQERTEDAINTHPLNPFIQIL